MKDERQLELILDVVDSLECGVKLPTGVEPDKSMLVAQTEEAAAVRCMLSDNRKMHRILSELATWWHTHSTMVDDAYTPELDKLLKESINVLENVKTGEYYN